MGLSYKSRALTIRSNAHKRDPRELPCSFYEPEDGPDRTLTAGILIWTFYIQKNWGE